MLLVTNTGSFRIALGKLLESLGYLAFLIVPCCRSIAASWRMAAWGFRICSSRRCFAAHGLCRLQRGAVLLGFVSQNGFGHHCRYIVVLAIGLMTFLGVTLSGTSSYYDFDLAALSREELIALLPKAMFFAAAGPSGAAGKPVRRAAKRAAAACGL